MGPVVGVGRAFVVFQQQWQVEIAGLESFGNKIPVLNHGLHKPLYILLRSEALCVGHLTTAPYLRQKLGWWDCARPADQRRDESVQLFQIHGAFVAEPAKSLGEIIEFGVGKLWRSHSTFLSPYGTVKFSGFREARGTPFGAVRPTHCAACGSMDVSSGGLETAAADAQKADANVAAGKAAR